LRLKQHTENHGGLLLDTETFPKGFPDRDATPIKLSAGNFEGLGVEPLINHLQSAFKPPCNPLSNHQLKGHDGTGQDAGYVPNGAIQNFASYVALRQSQSTQGFAPRPITF
jgi:hypothetical protein